MQRVHSQVELNPHDPSISTDPQGFINPCLLAGADIGSIAESTLRTWHAHDTDGTWDEECGECMRSAVF